TAAACGQPDLPILSDAGGDGGADASMDSTVNDASEDRPSGAISDSDSPEGPAESATDSAIDVGGDGSGSIDGAIDATGEDGGTTPLSCQAEGSGLTNCGATSESCCTSLEVPGGTYYRTYTNSGGGAISEADPATVSGFR